MNILSDFGFFLDNNLEICQLGAHVSNYPTICQGKTRIPGVNDGEEFELVHVSANSSSNV